MAYHSKYSGAEVDALLDKIKDDNVGSIDSSLSTTSENPVKNKVITEELNKKVDKVEGKQLSTEDFTSELKGKLDGLSNYDDTNLKGELEVLKGKVDEKQDYIADLDSIRSGASKGSTAIQEHQDISHLLPKSDFETYATKTDSQLTELESQLTDLYGIEIVEKVSTTQDTSITPDRSWLVQVQNGHKYLLVINAQWGITQFSGIAQNNAMLYVDNGNGSAYFSHSLSTGFSVMEHTLTANTETLNIRYRADNGSTVSLTIIDISDQKTLYALDKRIVIDAILSEAFTVDSLTRDSDGNVISGNIKYSDGIAGTIAITRNADGNATSMVATHGTDSYTLSITRNANGDVTKTSIN